MTEPKKPMQVSKVVAGVIRALGITVWVMAAFVVAQLLVSELAPSGAGTAELTLFVATVYVVAIGLAIGLPWFTLRHKTTRQELALKKPVAWRHVAIAAGGFVVYIVVSATFMYFVSRLVSGFDMSEQQDTGFDQLFSRFDYWMAFIAMVVVAPIAEEVLFRGYLYGKLRRVTFRWVAALLVAVAFAVAHGQWNVAVDTFVLSIALVALRELTGSLWPAIVLHMIKNGIAFYFVFVNPII